ncbi:hypothetical protein JXL19_02035 [bacterium]|nr:hypothetical protein [bacterium]
MIHRKKLYPFYLSGFKIGFAILVIWVFIFAAFGSKFANAQTRGLGFKGLVPPAGAKQKKYKIRVEALDLPLILAKDSKGEAKKVFTGPPGFLESKGFAIYKGQRLVIQAVPVKVEGKEIFVAFEMKDEDTDMEILLRNPKGEPLWWGGDIKPGTREKRQ